ncbi:heavy metal translocating P-type ATPase [Halorarum halobium]|uniref:heavy metal translocating P-type ATPase n=1 Tax=Halorarum halobium TaxID=3075121 RepID=UPI0028B04EBE|nr:heavy metal translocating P-type ATPase [Halobaculum sp. XH14]
MTDSSDGPDGPADGDPFQGDRPDEGDVVSLSVPDMDCASCADKVESSVSRLDGVEGIDARPTTGRLVVTYDRGTTDADAVAGRVEAAGYEVADGEEPSLRLSVPDMDCASCAGKVSAAIEGVAGAREYDTMPTTGTVLVRYAPDATDREALVAAVESAGYEVVETADESDGSAADRGSVWRSRRAVSTWVAAGATAVGFLLANPLTEATGPTVEVAGTTVVVGTLFYLAAVALAGAAVFRNGYYSLRNRSLDMDLLMSVAISGAVIVSVGFAEPFYFEAAMLATLFGVAELLEEYAMDRARTSLRELMDLSPDEATVVRDGDEVTVPAEDVDVGETVVVRPGEKIPRDGVVRDGTSAVNQAPVTGESVPVDKTAGDEVFAGTVNEEGYLEIEVTSAAGEDTLARIVDLVEDAQANRTEREQFVERFAGYYTPVVVTAAALLAVVPPLAFGAPAQQYVVYGLTLIVLACPCAFVISTPVTVVSGLTSAARNGVLVKGGDHLEAMGDVDAVAFDKTGTLTRGELAVTDVVPLGDRSEADVLECARGLELRSEHPIGDAIVEHAEGNGDGRAGSAGSNGAAGDAAEREISAFESITGKGVAAELGGRQHYAGKPGLFEELGFDLSHVHAATDGGVVTRTTRELCERHNCLDLLEDTVPALQSEGKTVVLVGTEDELEGVIAVADEVRPEARRTVERLREAGVATAMLTGDNDRTARAIAEEVGVDEYRAELLPKEKVAAVEELQAEHGTAAMVGDGINDAPALATATVGVAMGAAGTDTALETADIALLADDLTKLPYLYELANTGNGIIRQNVWTSLAAKAALALGVPFGLVPIWAAVLVGDAGMTTGVTANAMRLARISPADEGAESGDAVTAASEA